MKILQLSMILLISIMKKLMYKIMLINIIFIVMMNYL